MSTSFPLHIAPYLVLWAVWVIDHFDNRNHRNLGVVLVHTQAPKIPRWLLVPAETDAKAAEYLQRAGCTPEQARQILAVAYENGRFFNRMALNFMSRPAAASDVASSEPGPADFLQEVSGGG